LAKTKIIHQLDFSTSIEMPIGLVRCAKKLPEHSFFYQLNTVNPFFFERKKDLFVSGKYFDLYYPVFEAHEPENDFYFRFFSNHACKKIQKIEIAELFALDDISLCLFPKEEIGYITTCSYNSPEFSLILQPEEPLFQLENHILYPEDSLFDLIQYYE
jgi:hypothetical protein